MHGYENRLTLHYKKSLWLNGRRRIHLKWITFETQRFKNVTNFVTNINGIHHNPFLCTQCQYLDIDDLWPLDHNLELGQYRFFKSVSVFGFFGRFFKSRYRFRYRFSKYRDIGFGFSARTYHCLSNNTIADTLRPALSPRMGFGPSNLHYKLRP